MVEDGLHAESAAALEQQESPEVLERLQTLVDEGLIA